MLLSQHALLTDWEKTAFRRKLSFLLAHPRGFEPPTCRLGGGRSILLSYGCIFLNIVAEKGSGVNKSGHIFLALCIDCQVMDRKGELIVARKQDTDRDVDDLIFQGEIWHQSER